MLASLSGVKKSYGSEEVLSGIDVVINERDRIGLIGVNGSGKSTLLKIITKELDIDSGEVFHKSGLRIGTLNQNLNLDSNETVYSEALKAHEKLISMENRLEELLEKLSGTEDRDELERLTKSYDSLRETFEENKGYYYKSLTSSTLKGLGFSDEDLQRKISTLSGGQKMRVALAKILLEEPELLLLDEPTNYLDLRSISWLEGYLQNYPHTYIIVSHDRYFLETTVTQIWEMVDGTIEFYKGNYAAYVTQRDERFLARMNAYKKNAAYIAKQKAVIEKLKSFNREKSIKRAESREKLLAKVEVLEKPKENKVAGIKLEYESLVSRNILKLVDLTIGYPGKVVASGFNMDIKAGDCIGICADNATGKSTLLKTITGQIEPISGEVIIGSGVSITHFKQEHEDLNPENTIVDELVQYSGKDVLAVRNLLGGLLFTEDEVYKQIGVLSGGEKSRVAIAKLMIGKCNLLLLDEPTNHLDISSNEVFEEAMRNFEGTILVISHDRYLLRSLANRMIFIDKGKAYMYDLPYEEANARFILDTAPVEAVEVRKAETKPESRKGEAGKKPLSKDMRRRHTVRLEKLEEEMDAVSVERAKIEEDMNGEDFYKDGIKAKEILEHYDRLGEKYQELEDEWLEISYILENE
ncbi:MAG: ABC-F family ATP-binding cassette domain-containing protein [Eubacteriaceae bacterium]|nr:ABC-F family ATP-binding cassette domain-containing protein [Eubacteriaceae bacterium]